MAFTANQFVTLLACGILLFARPTHAFGAGNIASISKIEGQNWRHGDIEDVLLTLIASRAMGGRKFSKMDVKRIYFGNWLRDFSQAQDTGTLAHVSSKAITLVLWLLGFMSFGYATKEFEVTEARLGVYRPEEHIDNPKGYAEGQDARDFDRRLRGPVDEERELAIDPETGMKNYIASENMDITTSAGLIRETFGRCIDLGRRYNRSQNKSELYEALRLLGTGLHCLEDFSAHSNYIELALIEMGERNTFPHVGRNTQIRLRGARSPVYPLVTGTFGGVDFLHSVTGEFDDKVTQNEIQQLESTLTMAQQNQGSTSMLQDLLSKVPEGMFGDNDESGKADQLKQDAAAHQMSNTRISPRQPEEWLRYIDDARAQIEPILAYHDEVLQSINETIEKIPILPDLLEHLTEQLNIFVFSLIAPYILPIITQIKNELNTGSEAIIQSSVDQQHIVFNDDRSSDPTHSMLSKDHFSNVLNEPAGKVAGAAVGWVVPQIIACFDNERINVPQTLNRIIQGVLHHPALVNQGSDGSEDGRRLMFNVIRQWWEDKSEREKDGLREQLSREGVESGRNHKPGVKDCGHGSAKPMALPGLGTSNSSGAPGGGIANMLPGGRPGQSQAADNIGKMAGEAVGGGALGGLVGGLVSGLGGDLLGGGLENKQTFGRQDYDQDGSHTQTITQVGSSGGRYGQAQYSRTENAYGGQTEQYTRYEQSSSGGRYQSEVHYQERNEHGEVNQSTRRYDENDSYGRQAQSERFGGRRGEEQYGSESYGGQPEYGSSERYGSQVSRQSGSYGGRNEGTSYGRQTEESSFDGGYSQRHQESSYSSDRYSQSHEQTSRYSSGGYGQREDQGTFGGGGGGFGRQQDTGYGGSTHGRYDDDDDNRRSGGYGHQTTRDAGSQRQRRGSDDDNDNRRQQYGAQQSYGSRRGGSDSDDDERKHGGSRGYGGRRKDDDDDDDSDEDKKKKYRRGGDRHKDDSDDERGGYGRRRRDSQASRVVFQPDHLPWQIVSDPLIEHPGHLMLK